MLKYLVNLDPQKLNDVQQHLLTDIETQVLRLKEGIETLRGDDDDQEQAAAADVLSV